MASTSRALNTVEQKIHQACSTSDKKMLLQKDVDVLVPDLNARVSAINFLLSTGMLKMMQDSGKQISYKAVAKKEMEIKKEMGGDENMVLNHIQNAGNEGIWTKHLKGKTELHQTVINRCLKSLEQKGLIKAVKSVKYPTRKIYMMSHLEPSVEVTGGPWYSENELDTEFIKMLSNACLRFIQDKSYPKTAHTESEGNAVPHASAAPLYPISRTSSYPTAKTIHNWLQKSRLSEQELGVEHVEMLLDVLVFDGEIERLPAYGAGMWDMGAMDEDSEEERKAKKRKKKKEKEEEEERKKKKSKGKKRSRKDESSDKDSDEDKRKKKRRKIKDESDDSDDNKRKIKKKKKKRDDSDDDSDSDSDSEDDSEDDRKKSKKRKKSRSRSKSKSKSKSKRRSRSSSTSDSDSDSDSNSDSDSSDSSSTSRKKKKKSSRSSSKTQSKSVFHVDSEESEPGMKTIISSANVYRAVRQERVSLGLSQAPCGRCPVFDFCHENGPVNPRECTYYGEWLQQGIAEF